MIHRVDKPKGIHFYTFPGHIHCINPDKYKVCPVGYEEEEGGILGVKVRGYLDLGLEDCGQACNEWDGCTSIAYDLTAYRAAVSRHGTLSRGFPEDACKLLVKKEETTVGKQRLNLVNHLHCNKGKVLVT